MSRGEVMGHPPPRWLRQIYGGIFAIVTLVLVLIVADQWQRTELEMQRIRFLKEIGAPFLADLKSGHLAPTATIEKAKAQMTPDIRERYLWSNPEQNPGSADILIMENPGLIHGNWIFALYGDGHVGKIDPRRAATHFLALTSPAVDDRAFDDRRTIRVGTNMSAAMTWLTITKHQKGGLALEADNGSQIAQFSVDRGTLVITYRSGDGRITDLSFLVVEFGRPKGEREVFAFQVDTYEAATGRLVLSTKPTTTSPAVTTPVEP